MSKRGYIQRYLFIIRKVKSSDFPTLQELVQGVKEELAFHQMEDVGVSVRTIQRDIEDIRYELGISIDYNRQERGYYIPTDEEVGDDYIERVLEPFDILNALGADSGMQNYMMPEVRKAQGTQHLFGLLHAIKNNYIIKILHRSFQKEKDMLYEVQPYGLKEVKGRWYLIAMHVNELKTFGLDRIQELEITKSHFKHDTKVDIHRKYQDCFGIIADEQYPIETVELAFDALDGKYLKTYPLHSSQTVISDTPNEFRIKLKLRITPDFIMELLSRSNSIRIISPLSLRKKISDTWQKAISRNK
jgi:predicted DNA-binding transcriptional regulator YafY